jgi:hypothetical protein
LGQEQQDEIRGRKTCKAVQMMARDDDSLDSKKRELRMNLEKFEVVISKESWIFLFKLKAESQQFLSSL